MKFGTFITKQRGEAIAADVCAAERLGFESAWIAEHLILPVQQKSTYPYSADGRFLAIQNETAVIRQSVTGIVGSSAVCRGTVGQEAVVATDRVIGHGHLFHVRAFFGKEHRLGIANRLGEIEPGDDIVQVGVVLLAGSGVDGNEGAHVQAWQMKLALMEEQAQRAGNRRQLYSSRF